MKYPAQSYIDLTDNHKARLQKHDSGGSPHNAKFYNNFFINLLTNSDISEVLRKVSFS